jgi:hypothetical protein
MSLGLDRIIACCFFLLAAFVGSCAAFLSLPGFLGAFAYLAAILIGAAGLLILFSRPKAD